jgi:hypothetical protein
LCQLLGPRRISASQCSPWSGKWASWGKSEQGPIRERTSNEQTVIIHLCAVVKCCLSLGCVTRAFCGLSPSTWDKSAIPKPRSCRTLGPALPSGLSDHVIALNEAHLRRSVLDYVCYYHEDRTRLGLENETPGGRIRARASGRVLSQMRVGGLHHRYERAASSNLTFSPILIYMPDASTHVFPSRRRGTVTNILGRA